MPSASDDLSGSQWRAAWARVDVDNLHDVVGETGWGAEDDDGLEQAFLEADIDSLPEGFIDADEVTARPGPGHRPPGAHQRDAPAVDDDEEADDEEPCAPRKRRAATPVGGSGVLRPRPPSPPRGASSDCFEAWVRLRAGAPMLSLR